MANADGIVKIEVITNAKEASKELDNVSNSFKKTGQAAQRVDTVFNSLQNGVNKNIEALREMALGGGQNSREFHKLAQQTREYKKALEEANQAVEKATSTTNNTVKNTSKSFMDLEVAGVRVGTALKGVTYIAVARKLYEIGQQALKTAAEFEQLEVSFKIMAGGAAQGEKLTQSLINLANKTPMTTEGLARATQTLLAFGESSDNIIKDLQLLGDISGGQEQRFQSLALAFAQVGSTGRLTGQDLLQMVNQGFNPLQAISEKTGKSMAQLKKEMGEGKISFDMVKQAMVDATSEGGRFYGLMNEQSETLNGKLSTLDDTWQQVSKTIGDKFLPVAKTSVDLMIKIGQATQNTITWLESEKSTLVGLKEAWDKYWASRRKSKATLTFSMSNEWMEEQRKSGIFAKNADTSKTSKNTTGGFSSGNGGLGGGSASVEKAKDQYEKLQEAVSKAKREIELAAIAHGTSSQQVQNAFIKYQQLNGQLQEISKLFEVEKVKTEEKKGSYQQLSDRVSDLTQKLRDLATEQKIGSADWVQYKQDLTNAQAELDAVNQSLENNGIKIDEASKKISSSLSSGLISALRSGGSAFDVFSNMAVNALQRVLDKILEMAVIKPLLNSFSGGIGGSLLSFFGFKDGAAFKNGNVIPFAHGGVVNKPTLFPMANGGTGLMGEAGAEAVMPLKRMSNGKLGVEAETSGGQVVNIYNYSGANVETRKRDDNSIDVFIRRVNDALSNERTSSGFRSAYSRENNKGVQAV